MRQESWKIFQRCILPAFGVLILGIFYELWIYHARLPKLPPLEKRIKTVRTQIAPENFCFAVVADNRNDKGVFPKILEKIQKDPEIAFVIHLGDAVMAPRKVFYLDLLRTLNADLHKPFFIIPGNHDVRAPTDDSLYEKAFGPRHYWLKLGKIFLVMADSNALRAEPENEIGWLKNILLRKESGEMGLNFMHVPPLDPRGGETHHCLSRRLAKNLASLLKKGGIMHIYSGHIHGYWSGTFEGIPYTITGGGGAWLNSRNPAHGFYHFLKIKVCGNKISQQVVRVKRAFFPGLLSYLYYSKLTGMELMFLTLLITCLLRYAYTRLKGT